MKPNVGDPKWAMRRRVMFGVFGYCGFLIVFAFFWPPEKINAVANLLPAVSAIVMPIMVVYFGVVETADYLKSTKIRTTTEMPATPVSPGRPKVTEEKVTVMSQAMSAAPTENVKPAIGVMR